MIVDLNEKFEVDPQEIESILLKAISTSLAKGMAIRLHKPWSDWQEEELQEQISELVMVAMNRGLLAIKLIIFKRDGQRITREFDVAKINAERSLQ